MDQGVKLSCALKEEEPLKVMISGAPASGKGTQCELIVKKFGLVHISTGDLLRAEVSSGTEIGNKAKEFMNAGKLVSDEIVTALAKTLDENQSVRSTSTKRALRVTPLLVPPRTTPRTVPSMPPLDPPSTNRKKENM